jgi:hypothetical protein
VSRAKSLNLKEMLDGFQRAGELRAERERRLAQLARKIFGNPTKAERIAERIRQEADSRSFAIPRRRALHEALGFLPSGGPLIPALLDAAAAERVARSANVRVRDLRTGRANEKLRRARGNRSWEEITYASLKQIGIGHQNARDLAFKKQDVRQLARRRLNLTESKQSKQAEILRAFETVVSIIREIDGRVPGYTRDTDNAKVCVPSLGLVKTAVELLIGTPVPLSAETAVKWLQIIRRGERLAPPRVVSFWCPPSVLEQIPDSEREAMRADSARNLQLIRELGADGIPTRAIVAPDDAESWARLNPEHRPSEPLSSHCPGPTAAKADGERGGQVLQDRAREDRVE